MFRIVMFLLTLKVFLNFRHTLSFCFVCFVWLGQQSKQEWCFKRNNVEFDFIVLWGMELPAEYFLKVQVSAAAEHSLKMEILAEHLLSHCYLDRQHLHQTKRSGELTQSQATSIQCICATEKRNRERFWSQCIQSKFFSGWGTIPEFLNTGEVYSNCKSSVKWWLIYNTWLGSNVAIFWKIYIKLAFLYFPVSPKALY